MSANEIMRRDFYEPQLFHEIKKEFYEKAKSSMLGSFQPSFNFDAKAEGAA